MPLCLGDVKPLRSIHFRDLPDSAGAFRPFHAEGIRDQPGGVPIAFRSPRIYKLPAGLLTLCERQKRSSWLVAGFFKEFPQRRTQRFFAFLIFALCQGPGSQIFSCPKWPARMDKQYFQFVASPSIQEDPCACFRHGDLSDSKWDYARLGNESRSNQIYRSDIMI